MMRFSFKKKWTKNSWLFLILLIATILRFIFYSDRLILNQDQGRDATIALYANRNFVFPQIGSPSSAGAFNFGPWYFWLIMFWERVIPFSLGPWIGFTLMSVLSVFFYSKTGEILAGKKGLVITGLIAAVAPGLVLESPNMLNTVIVGFSSSLVLFTTAKLFKEDKLIWAILLGFFVGLSINFHFQSLGLLCFPLVAVVVNKFSLIKRFKIGFSAFIGLLISFLPLIFFDLNRNGIWLKSVIRYYTVDIKKFYVPLRWLTELRDFWPQFFGSVTTGIPNLGYLWLVLGVITLILILKKKEKIDNFWIALGLAMLIQVLLMRSYKGPRSNEYLIAFQGLIILICSWILINLYNFKKNICLILLISLISFASYSNLNQIKQHPSQMKTIFSIKSQLDSQINGSVDFYKYQDSNMVAMPLFYLFYYQNRIDNNGQKLVLCDNNRFSCPSGSFLSQNNYMVYKLDTFQNDSYLYQLTPQNIYQILMVNYGN